MDTTTVADKITEWLTQQVDPAFGPLLTRIATSGTEVRWEEGEFARTIRIRCGDREVSYMIAVDPASEPIAGQVQFQSPETESCKPFSPAWDGRARSPGEMTGSDLVDDLIAQYGQRLRHVLHPEPDPDPMSADEQLR